MLNSNIRNWVYQIGKRKFEGITRYSKSRVIEVEKIDSQRDQVVHVINFRNSIKIPKSVWSQDIANRGQNKELRSLTSIQYP